MAVELRYLASENAPTLGARWDSFAADRFSDLERAIPAISQKMLIQQLRQLERDGIVARIVHAQVPPKVEYHMTKWGQSLCPALDELLTWAERQPSSPTGSQREKAARPPRG